MPCRSITFVLSSLVLVGCRRPSPPTTEKGDAATAEPAIATRAPLEGGTAAPGCTVTPRGGVAIPASARATEIRLASAGGKALVAWYQSTKSEGPDVLASYGHTFDGTALGERITFDTSDVGDEFFSGAAPVASGGDLLAFGCYYAAPAGGYSCWKRPAAGSKTTLFDFRGIATGGPARAGIAAVASGDDALLFVPEGGASDVLVFSARVSGKKKSYPFATAGGSDGPRFAEGLGAVLTGPDEGTVVYRFGASVFARRAGFDQAWRGKPTTLSTKGALVGAPVVARNGDRVVVLFSERAKATDPWRVMRAEWTAGAEPTRTELPTGAAQAQGPAIAATNEPGCFLVSWVEGGGKTTRTLLARTCGTIAKDTAVPISADGIEGGRAVLAADPVDPASAFVVWQELPAGKPAELRIGRVSCR